MNRRDFGKAMAAIAANSWFSCFADSGARANAVADALNAAAEQAELEAEGDGYILFLSPSTYASLRQVTVRARWRDEYRRIRLALQGIEERDGMTWRGPRLGWTPVSVGQLGRVDGIRILSGVPAIDESEWRVCPHCLDEVPRATYYEHVQKDHGMTVLEGVPFEP